MTELARLEARGPRSSDWSAEDHFSEERLWARWVDLLDEQVDHHWRKSLQAKLAWAVAGVGWAIAAILAALLWWRSLRG